MITLERQSREAQNVVNEKEEEMYMLTERVEELVGLFDIIGFFVN